MLGFVFWKKGLQRRFPAMGAYLALRVISTPILAHAALIRHLSLRADAVLRTAYFFFYWSCLHRQRRALFFICIEVFRSALSSLPGLMKFGIVIFRWAVAGFAHRHVLLGLLLASRHHLIPDIAIGLMRSVSLLELCLLAFLCLSMNALRLSVRDLAFGIALGFGLMSANDFVTASLDHGQRLADRSAAVRL